MKLHTLENKVLLVNIVNQFLPGRIGLISMYQNNCQIAMPIKQQGENILLSYHGKFFNS